MAYDTQGLQFVPTYDEYDDLDLSYMFPVIKTPVFNHTIDGMLYFNYVNTYGSRFDSDDSVLFKGTFKVTATEGVYEINPYIYCLEDSNKNIIVNEGDICGEYTDDAYIGYDGPCIKVGNKYYKAIKGEEYELVYYLQVENNRVSSLDARIAYDTEGLDFVPSLSQGDESAFEYTFPRLSSPVFNSSIDGMLYFNYTNLTGANFQSEKSILFRGKFKVTATQGVYEIRPYIFCLGDSELNVIVDECEVLGEYNDYAVLNAKYEIGDANRDGKISVFDVTEIQRYIAGFIGFDKKQTELADMNRDGVVNIFDATAVARYIAYGEI